jgi:hypothetical protein
MYESNLYLIVSIGPAADRATYPLGTAPVLVDSARYAAQPLRST